MALLSASCLTKSFGANLIFSGASFEIQENDHVGLVGVNGCGKTTLFKILTGEIAADEGAVYPSGNCKIGYMQQHVCRDLNRSAYNEVLTVFSSLIETEKELEYVNQQLRACPENTEELINKQMHLNESFLSGGGMTFRSRARSTLLGLGFSEEQIGMPVGVLSGGQKAKLQLAKMLLSGATLLLLDEPTNHLDIASVEWLEDFLRSYNGAYVIISHDRFFLDNVTSRTFEMQGGRLTVYKGNYTAYLAQKDENQLSLQRKYDNTMHEIKRLQGIVEQQRRWNREKNIKTAESKLKVIERLQNTLIKPESSPDALRFHFGTVKRGGNDVLTAEDLSLSFDGRKLFSHVNMEIHHQERIFLIGANGCGKTSLFRILMQQYQPDSGTFRFGANIDVGYYDQIQAGLHEEKTVLDEIWDSYPRMKETEVRSALAMFLFKGEDVYKTVGSLSGGERARVLMLRLMLSKANFLLLDEPTNHLDITSCEALEDALLNYEGTLFIVSHDRYLINKLADRIYCLTPHGAEEYNGNYDYYLERRKEQKTEQDKRSEPKVNLYKLRKEQDAKIRKQKSHMKQLENQMEENDARIAEIEAQLQQPELAADYEAAMELTSEMDLLHQKNESLLLSWEEAGNWLQENEKAT